MIFFVEPDKQASVAEALNGHLHVPFRFDNAGSEIIFHHTPYDAVGRITDIEAPSVGYGKSLPEPTGIKIEDVAPKRQYDSDVISSH